MSRWLELGHMPILIRITDKGNIILLIGLDQGGGSPGDQNGNRIHFQWVMQGMRGWWTKQERLGIGRRSTVTTAVCHHRLHISAWQKLAGAESVLPFFRGAHGVFNLPRCLSRYYLFPICLNIYFTCLAPISLWVGDPKSTLQVCCTFVERAPPTSPGTLDNQSDWLFICASPSLPVRYCLSTSQRTDTFFPLGASLPPHILLLVMYRSCGLPGKPQLCPWSHSHCSEKVLKNLSLNEAASIMN